MIHLPELISDLGVILITAASVTLLFRFLKQPVVLGYIIAGLLVGPHVSFTPSISDSESIKIWAEIGVIFLLFGLGLEFSFKKLARVGKPASVTASFEVIFMLCLGFLAGQAFGWSKMDSLFLGGILSISSTTIIVRAFDELGYKTRKFVSLVFGVLVVEDLFAILLLVLLSTVAATQSLSGWELANSALRLGFFLILWFLVGIYVIPVVLKKIRPLLTDETALIVSIGLCLMMVMIATKVGFSPALGAFIMGSIIAETRDGKRIEHLLLPVRDLFAAIFFVSVGMLIDPRVIFENWDIVLAVTLLTIFGKFFSSVAGALISGQRLKHSVQAGMSLAQIGEFSFIIATLGVTLKVTSDFLYPVAVSVSAITTFTTPYMIKHSTSFFHWIDARIPAPLAKRLGSYNATLSDRTVENIFSLLFKAYGLKIILNSVMVIAVTSGSKQFLLPYVREYFGQAPFLTLGVGVLVLLLCSPFIWAIVFSAPSQSLLRNGVIVERLSSLQFGVSLFRVIVAIFLIGFVVSQFFSVIAVSGLVLLLLALFVIFLSRFVEPFYQAFEKRFILNLNDKEDGENRVKDKKPVLAPWDATLAEFVISPHSDLVAKNLVDSQLKEKFGVTVALIQRGHRRIIAPGREDLLLPFDKIFLIGSEDQLEAARKVIEVNVAPEHYLSNDSFGLESLVLSEKSVFIGKPIRTCGLREAISGLIVGIEREGRRILSPDAAMVLQAGDLIWAVGDRNLIHDVTTRDE